MKEEIYFFNPDAIEQTPTFYIEVDRTHENWYSKFVKALFYIGCQMDRTFSSMRPGTRTYFGYSETWDVHLQTQKTPNGTRVVQITATSLLTGHIVAVKDPNAWAYDTTPKHTLNEFEELDPKLNNKKQWFN